MIEMDLEEVPILESEQKRDIEMLPIDLEVTSPTTTQRGITCNGLCLYSKQETTHLESEHRSKSARKLCGLVIFYLIAMVIEVVGGLKANSLAVITDAGHLLTDIAGFLISLLTVWASGWEAKTNQSFGYYRIEIFGALISVQLIWLISGILVYEAIDRFIHEHAQVNGKLMFLVAAFGFIVNLIMVLWLGHGHDRVHDHNHHSCVDKLQNHHNHHACADKHHSHHNFHGCSEDDHNYEEGDMPITTEEEKNNLVATSSNDHRVLNINIQGAHLHVIADMIQSIGVMIAGAVIWIKPNWLVADLICTLVFSFLVLGTTISMLRNIFSILMNMAPREIDVASLENGLRNIKGAQDIHDLHIWAITVGKFVLTCHVTASPGVTSSDILNRIRDYCGTIHGIHHMTVQIE